MREKKGTHIYYRVSHAAPRAYIHTAEEDHRAKQTVKLLGAWTSVACSRVTLACWNPRRTLCLLLPKRCTFLSIFVVRPNRSESFCFHPRRSYCLTHLNYFTCGLAGSSPGGLKFLWSARAFCGKKHPRFMIFHSCLMRAPWKERCCVSLFEKMD